MLISMGAHALREFLATAIRQGTVAAGCTVVLLFTSGQSAKAQVLQDFYETPFWAPTGVFEWDNFTTTFGSTPDTQASGIGSSILTLNSVAQPFDGPPIALVTSTSNIYTGGTLTDFSVNLSELDGTENHTTVVLQLSAIGSFSGFALNGQEPTEFLNRGTVQDVVHGTGAAPFDTNFYWIEWQLDSLTDLEITFENTETHQSLAGIRVDYFNSSSATDVAAPDVLTVPVLLGDVNLDARVDFLDIPAFISILSTGDFQAEADMDGSDQIDFLDISPFISALSGS